MKLVLGYTAVIVSAITFYLDWTQGFEATKTLTTAAVIIYFALNGAFTYWIWGVEKGVVFTGSWKGRNITLTSRTEKFTPIYKLAVTYDKADGKKEEVQVEALFMLWFTEDGAFAAKPFQQWLAGSVALIGEADPKNATKSDNGGVGLVKTQTVHSQGVKDVLADIARDAQKAQGKASRKKA